MRPVENANFLEQDNSHTAAFPLANLCAKFDEESLDVAPLNIATRRASED